MIKAVLREGKIVALDPLPPEWTEGQPLRIEEGNGAEEALVTMDRVYAELEALCAQGDPEDDRRWQTALATAHEQAKATMRKQMGLA